MQEHFDGLRDIFRQRYNVGHYDCEAEDLMQAAEAGSTEALGALRSVVEGMTLYRHLPDALAHVDAAVAAHQPIEEQEEPASSTSEAEALAEPSADDAEADKAPKRRASKPGPPA